MALFKRNKAKQQEPAVHPVTAFWSWWAAEGRELSPHQVSSATDELTRLVQKINPELTWHFGPGESAQHRLTVTAGGVAAARPSAERWYRAAPPADETWEFRPSQEADPRALEQVLEIAGQRLDLAETSFRVEPDEQRLRVHVGVHHPAFATAPPEVRQQVTFLVLDWLVGEDAVERWLGEIEPLVDAPEPALPGDVVVAAVTDLDRRRDPEEWAIAQWTDEQGAPGLVTFRRWLRWLDAPTLDRHHVITMGYPARADGMPADADILDDLGLLEDRLVGVLGGRGTLLAYETSRGARTFHIYTDSEDRNVDADLAAFAGEIGAMGGTSEDPSWRDVRHFTG